MTSTLNTSCIAQNLYWKNIDSIALSDHLKEQAKSQVASVAAIEEAFTTAIAKINADGNLSVQGRANAQLQQSKKSLADLAKMTDPTLVLLNNTIFACEKALRKASSGADSSVVSELRAIEARGAFALVEPLMRESVYIQLCESGLDDAACLAVENACAFAPLLSANVIEHGKAIRGARILPDQAIELDAAIELRSILTASISAAKRSMKLGVTNDPMQIAAMGNFPIDEELPDALDAVDDAVNALFVN